MHFNAGDRGENMNHGDASVKETGAEDIKGNAEKEFKYVEFIRNPRIIRQDDGDTGHELKWMAFDYFDFIDIRENIEKLIDCMDYQNEIPCEAYQSIGIFRDGNAKKQNDQSPFMAVLQVTFLKEAYQDDKESNDGQLFYEDEKKKLEDAVGKIVDNFVKEHAQNCLFDFGIYYTVNNIDFCILLYMDRLDLAEYIANHIKAIQTPRKKPKYSVYTTVGISSGFKVESGKHYMDPETVLVARVHLRRKFYSETIIQEFCKNLGRREKGFELKPITNTHSLPGKYDLSIRVDTGENILKVLPFIVKYKFGIDSVEKLGEGNVDEEEDAISFLLRHDCVRYINTRIFCNGEVVFHKIENEMMEIQEAEKWEKKQLEECMELREKVNALAENFNAGDEEDDYFYFRPVIKGYLEKLKRIIHTCGALSFNDDTKVNMIMLRKYLDSFLKLMELNAEFLKKGLIAQKDYAKNVLTGINYIEQYTKIITSVNGNSFETPQFGTERDECSIGKLPIAYTEYLCNVFNSYYEERQNRKRAGDEEIKYFPKYFPLIVPYMLDGDSDCMMSTLLSQNMSDEWEKVKSDWEKYIEENHEVLMFIICQDMKKYKDVSSLLVSSFHELGHYCNRITRRERNVDLLHIYANEIAEIIVKRWIGSAEIGYRTMVTMEIKADLITVLERAVYEALAEYMEKHMEKFLDYPQSVFTEKFLNKVEQLCDPYFNCYNDEISKDALKDELFELADFKFGLAERYEMTEFAMIKELQEKACTVLKQLKKELDDLFDGGEAVDGNSKLTLNQEDLENLSVKNMLAEVRQFVSASLLIWTRMSWQQESMETDDLTFYKVLVNGIDISGFVKREFRGRETSSKRLIDNFNYIREVLEYDHEVLIFCMKCSEKAEIDKVMDSQISKRVPVIGEEKEYSEEESLLESISLKHQLIESAFQKYTHSVEDDFEGFEVSKNSFYDCYAKMHITPDSGFLSGFKKSLNQSLMGLDIRDSALDLARSCYEESLADISMCANLELEAQEYLAVVMNYFEHNFEKDAKWKTYRLVIVLSYLWFVRNTEQGEENDLAVENMITGFEENVEKLKMELGEKAIVKPVSEMLEMIRNKYAIIIDSKLFEVAMKRVNMLHPYLCFLNSEEKKDVTFIHKDLRGKIKSRKKESDKKEFVEVQNQEIDFFLKYYYRNRKTYADE